MESFVDLQCDPFELYCLYVALKAHFSTKTFDYTKYGHRNLKNITIDTFRKRSDEIIWYRMARRMDIQTAKEFFISQFVENFWMYSFEMAQNMGIAWNVYLDWRKRVSNIVPNYKRDLQFLGEKVGDWTACIKANGVNYPKIFQLVLRKYISQETYSYFVWMFDLTDKRKYKTLENKDIFDTINHKYRKYAMLLPVKVEDIVKITPRCLNNSVK